MQFWGKERTKARESNAFLPEQSVSSHHLSELPGLASDHAKGAFDLEGRPGRSPRPNVTSMPALGAVGTVGAGPKGSLAAHCDRKQLLADWGRCMEALEWKAVMRA